MKSVGKFMKSIKKFLLYISFFFREKNGRPSKKAAAGVMFTLLFLQIVQIAIYSDKELSNQVILQKAMDLCIVVICFALFGFIVSNTTGIIKGIPDIFNSLINRNTDNIDKEEE